MNDSNRCMACGQPLRSTSVYCPHCGQVVPKPAKTLCECCGAILEPGAKFCAHCCGPVRLRKPVPPPPAPAGMTWWPATDQLSDLCGSAACLTLVICLTVQLLGDIWARISPFNFVGLLSLWPEILICIGGWICFAGGRKKRLTTTGFGLISGTLNFFAFLNCIGFAIGCIFGLLMVVNLSEDYKVIGLAVLVVCGISVWLTWTYWRQLRLPAYSARRVVLNGSGPVSAGLFSIVLLLISAIGNLFHLIGLLTSQGQSSALYYAIYRVLTYLPEELAELLHALLPQQNTPYLLIIDVVLSFAIPLLAALILMRLRRERHDWVR